MIYTITFNPSLDYLVNVPDLNIGGVNRSSADNIYVGGKGLNVSIVLKNLGLDNKSLGFIAGFTGKEILNLMDKVNCECNFVELEEGNSRINIKIKGNIETEINGQGPSIKNTDIEKLFDKLSNLKNGDILVLAGSIPSTLSDNIYEVIMEKLQDKNISFVIDATKDLLSKSLKYKPFLIKPNNHELGEIFNKKLTTNEEIIEHAKKLKKQGAKNVLVSMAGDGAILVDENDDCHYLPAPNGTLVNSVGAGDSMVAGFITGWVKFKNYKDAFKMAVATGSASAFSEWLAEESKVMEIYNNL